jgi:nuclear transport factor 2 (NTF2) superfamily protein
MTIRYPIPPFDHEKAEQKVKAAEEAWNSKDPYKVSLAYSVDSKWRNRSDFINGRKNIEKFLEAKWRKERSYRLKKTLWSFTDNRIAVTFFYEWHDDSGNWFRSFGNELWEFDEKGYMTQRIASINDLVIDEQQRQLGVQGAY